MQVMALEFVMGSLASTDNLLLVIHKFNSY